MKKSKYFLRGVAFATLIFQLVTFDCVAQYKKLYDFVSIGMGKDPYGSLVSDGIFLYGVTTTGGTADLGTIFKIKSDGTGFSKIFDFTGTTNGAFPRSSLIYDGTFLYGTTAGGGANFTGTIFKIQTDGTGYSMLYDFTVTADGLQPSASLISIGSYLYGTTYDGGTNNCGVIFKIMPNGTGYTKIFDFTNTTGKSPRSTLIYDGTFLYGTTLLGGTGGFGTVFKILLNGTGFLKLLDFSGTANGSYSTSALLSDGGFLFGTAGGGGIADLGVLFKINPNGTGFSKLFDFNGLANGDQPTALIISAGNFFYGMTYKGGTGDFGVVFKIMPDGSGYSKLHDFTGTATGSGPNGSFISDGTFLYGMTSIGGLSDYGTIFKYCLIPITFTQSPQICAGESLTVGSNIYSTGGTYYDSLISSQGCDSIVTTNLTINDVGVSVTPSTLTANSSTATYQWINCNGNTPVSGATNQVFSPTATGDFAVIVTEKNCSDTSSCYNLIAAGIVENGLNAIATIHPNPSTSQTTITFAQEHKQGTVRILNSLGKEVKLLNFSGKQLIIEKGDLLPDTYFMELNTEQGKVVQKLIISNL